MNSLKYFIGNQQKNSNWVWSWGKIWAKLIMPNVVKSKETGNIIRFFPYFTWDYLLKQEAVVVKPPEWKFISIIARNTKFSGCLGQFFARFGSKMTKKTDIIQ